MMSAIDLSHLYARPNRNRPWSTPWRSRKDTWWSSRWLVVVLLLVVTFKTFSKINLKFHWTLMAQLYFCHCQCSFMTANSYKMNHSSSFCYLKQVFWTIFYYFEKHKRNRSLSSLSLTLEQIVEIGGIGCQVEFVGGGVAALHKISMDRQLYCVTFFSCQNFHAI